MQYKGNLSMCCKSSILAFPSNLQGLSCFQPFKDWPAVGHCLLSADAHLLAVSDDGAGAVTTQWAAEEVIIWDIQHLQEVLLHNTACKDGVWAARFSTNAAVLWEAASKYQISSPTCACCVRAAALRSL